jgi:hypothetical protein
MQKGPSDNLIAYKIISLCEDLSAIEKRVSSLIIDHHNRKTGQCDPSLGTMAKLLGVSRRTAIRAVNAVVRKGYFHMRRHGGKYHRNQYEPNWALFRAREEKWSSLRRRKLSPLQGQPCHVDSVASVTQTLPRNSLKETSCSETALKRSQTLSGRSAEKGLSREGQGTHQRYAANERFHVKPTSARDAAYDAAERRWNDSLTRQFKAAPDVFAGLIDSIDPDLHRATTEIELRKPGSGLPYLLGELDRRRPLQHSPSAWSPTKTTGPTRQVLLAGNSDRGGSPVRSDFHSLKTKLESLNTEPKEAGALEKTSRNSGGGGEPQAEQEGSEVQE